MFARGTVPDAPMAKKADPVKDAIADLEEQEDSRANYELAERIGQALSLHYPNHRWMVYVDRKAGHYHVKNLSLSGNWGYVMHPRQFENIEKMALEIGGEMLERYNIARSRAGAEQAAEFLRRSGKEYRAAHLARAKRMLRGHGIDWSQVQAQAVLVPSGQQEPKLDGEAANAV